MELFHQQAKDVDIIITTALIRWSTSIKDVSMNSCCFAAGKRAPKLVLKEHVEAMKRKSAEHSYVCN